MFLKRVVINMTLPDFNVNYITFLLNVHFNDGSK
jgi:hypothetical protein